MILQFLHILPLEMCVSFLLGNGQASSDIPPDAKNFFRGSNSSQFNGITIVATGTKQFFQAWQNVTQDKCFGQVDFLIYSISSWPWLEKIWPYIGLLGAPEKFVSWVGGWWTF